MGLTAQAYPVSAQQVSDRGRRYPMAKLEQLAPNPDAAPAGVTPSHLHDQFPELRRVGDSSLAQQGPLGQASRFGPQTGAAGQFHVYNPVWSLGG